MKRSALRRHSRPAASRPTRGASELPPIYHRGRTLWFAGIQSYTCAQCGRRRADDPHHVIRAQVLKREARRRGYDYERVRWDHRNRLPLCRGCHTAHHSGTARISLTLLRAALPQVFEFAKELGLEHVLEREHVA